jgi:hypothetical protein
MRPAASRGLGLIGVDGKLGPDHAHASTLGTAACCCRPPLVHLGLVSHYPTIFFSQNKSAINNQSALLFSSHRPPVEQADGPHAAVHVGVAFLWRRRAWDSSLVY